MAKMGRPSKYTDELADNICLLTATSNRGLSSICEELGICQDTARDWMEKHEYFSVKYARAKQRQATFLAEEIIAIADNVSNDILDGAMGPQGNNAAVSRAKVQIDARKWIASKLMPKVFGDKIDVTSDGNELKTKEVFVIGGKEFTFDK